MYQHRFRTVHASRLKSSGPELGHVVSGSAADVHNLQSVPLLWQISLDQCIQTLAAVSKTSPISVGAHVAVRGCELARLPRVDVNRSLFARVRKSVVHW